LEFYNPRRPQKYWTSEDSKHHSFKEAVATLAKQYDRSPEWIQSHMGETNDLYEIHQNLSKGKLNATVAAPEQDDEKVPETLFYNPRRSKKYWTSTRSKHNSFKEAIDTMASEYERTPQWVQEYMGTTNNLSEIHQNLKNQKEIEDSQ
jgi:lipoate synthase